MTGSLSHIKVLDLSRVFAGPWCAQMLADLGADVVKVEHPAGGDDVRRMGAALRDADGADTGERSSFLAMNRGKRSIAINLSVAAGQDIVRRLAAQSDVLIENFKTGTLARYGLDYASLSAINPRLVYCSITGFGHTGPRSQMPGYDAVFQAMSGVMSVTGPDQGAPGSEPCLIGYSASDINAGLYAAVAVLAALNHRDVRSGRGQHIDLSLLDAQIASMSHLVMNYLLSGQPPTRCGSASQINAPWKAFRCADGDLMITVGNERQFKALMAVLGRPEVADDARFMGNDARMANRPALMDLIEPLVATWPIADLSRRLVEQGAPCAKVLDVAEALEDPQVIARRAVASMEHPLSGAFPILTNPIRLSETPPRYDLPPPLLNEHCDEILKGHLGISEAELKNLRGAGAFSS